MGCITASVATIYFNNYEHNHVKNYCDSLGESFPSARMKELCENFKEMVTQTTLFNISYTNGWYYDRVSEQLNLNTFKANLTVLHFVNLVMVILMVLMFYVIFTNVATELDLANDTIEDFTLIIGNIPKNSTMKEIKETLVIDGIKPIEIIPTFKLAKIKELKQKIVDYSEKLKQCYKEKKTEYKSFFSKAVAVKSLDDELTKACKELDLIEHEFTNHTSELDSDHFAGQVIAIFNTEKEATEFKSKTEKNTVSKMLDYVKHKNDKIEINHIHVDSANEPTDLKWENLEYTFGERMIRISIIFALSIGLMIGSFAILYFLSRLQVNLKEDDPFIKLLLSLVFSAVINTINFVVSKILIIVTE